jgi:hypothetical protein
MADEKKQIFRQSSLDRIASPEQLNDYLRTTKPGALIILILIILLVVAFFAWASIGRLETTVSAKATVEDGNARIVILSEADVKAGMTVRVGESEFTISSVDKDEYGYPVANAPVTIPGGSYDVEIVIESIAPISFLFSS